MADIIIIAVVVLAVYLAMRYIIREKKKGAKCIGCPSAGTCSKADLQRAGKNCGCSSEK